MHPHSLPAYRAAIVLIVALALGAATTAEGQGRSGADHWVGTWATAPIALPAPDPDQAPSPAGGLFGTPVAFHNQTLRQIVRTSIGGSRVCVAFTNVFGTARLEIGSAHVGIREDGSTISGAQRLTFDGAPSTAVAAGATIVSDPVDLQVAALSDLAIDMYLPRNFAENPSTGTTHSTGLTTNYLSATGNHSGDAEIPVERTLQSWYFLARVDVTAAEGTPVIVTLGDSITDGFGATADTNSRWPDFLARRLVDAYGSAAPAVLNVGISGNRVLSHNAGLGVLQGHSGGDSPPPDPNAGFGPSALWRFDRDVLLQPGATHVLVMESINDIGMGFSGPSPTVDDLIAGHSALVQRAHTAGLTIYGGTLTPFEGAFYFTEEGEAKRQAFNAWIRTGGVYDGFVDFDAAVRDPSNPTRFLPDHHPGDWLHGSDVGYEAMAEAIDLTLFARDRHDATNALNTHRMLEDWGQLPEGVRWGAVIGIIPDGEGGAWIHHRSDPPIIKLDASGHVVKSFGDGMFVMAHGFCMDHDGNLWAGDSGSFFDNPATQGRGYQFFKFSQDGELLLTLGQAGVSRAGPDTFISPTACAVAANGDIMIADGHFPRPSTSQQDGDRILRFTKDGKLVDSWGHKGSGPGEFSGPHALAFDSQGRLFVADRSNDRLQIFGAEMQFVAEWKQFGWPSGVAITKDDTLYVADSESGKMIVGAVHNPGWRNGVRIGSATDGSVRAYIDGTDPEGMGVDELGNVFAGLTRAPRLSPPLLQKWVEKE